MSQHVFDFDHQWTESAQERRNMVGGKAANLNVMHAELGLPVPPAFTVSTETCNEYLATGVWPAGLDEELREHMARLEARLGRTFGGASDPLLVSVRSGAPVSMPGMMDTLLNLGLTDASLPGLAQAAGSREFADDCYERLDDVFRGLVGAELPQDPWDQLRAAIIAVFDSWNSGRARTYRQVEGIPDSLGTGVTVQAMVFGNRGEDSGTGVLFTRNPSTGENVLFGDVLFNAQGEEVVAGTHGTHPIGELATQFPAVYQELEAYAGRLERHFADMCDIEFTIEEQTLWLLQVRTGKRTPEAALRIAVEMAEDPDFPLSQQQAVERVAALLADPPQRPVEFSSDAELLGEGLGASPGVAQGHVVTEPTEAANRADAGDSVILVRPITSPNDVHGMTKSAGILTIKGGLTSHAAVVARGWSIPAVVGAHCVSIDDDRVRVGETLLEPYAVITIDGRSGKIYLGRQGGASEPVPEVPVLLGWADELGIVIATPDPGDDGADPVGDVASEGAPAASTTRDRAFDAEQVLRTLAVKGYGTSEALAAALVAEPEELTMLLAELVERGHAMDAGGMLMPTDAGRERGVELIITDGRAAGIEAAAELLDAFVPVDQAIKAIVQDWQLKPNGEGQLVTNDHADAAWDQDVLARVAGLHEEATELLSAKSGRFGRLNLYLHRLGHAAAQVAAGEGAYIASPRVDSYHSIWFELHEELIHLAGSTRSAEVEAGRA